MKRSTKLRHELSGLQSAAKALGDSTNREIKSVKNRILSATGRAAIAKAAKKRWAKVRKRAKRAVS
jgi:t-SNARE complex subunit (syntaxin)